MASYTVIGQELWLWQPFLALTALGRVGWLGLYSSPHARRTPVGLWHGGVPVLADAIHVSMTDAHAALDELVERKLVEHDQTRRVIGMLSLPDRGERPANGNCLKKWWNLYRSIPPCDVRDRWVTLLAWLVHPMTKAHEAVWSTTFGTLYPQPVDNSLQSAPHYLQDSTACEQPVDKQCALVFSGTPETHTDTVTDTHRNQGSGSGIRVSDPDQGSENRAPVQPRWAPPPPIVMPTDPRSTYHLAAIGAGSVAPTQEHDEHGRPWGPQGAPRDRFYNGRRRNF